MVTSFVCVENIVLKSEKSLLAGVRMLRSDAILSMF